LSGVPIHVTVELGRARLTLGDLCRLKAGALLELDREAHEPADILVNGKIVAHGEIVTIDGHYGVRITGVEPWNGADGNLTGGSPSPRAREDVAQERERRRTRSSANR